MIALSKDEVRILIKILVGDHWAFIIRDISLTTGGGGIDMLGKLHPRYSVIPPIKSAWKSVIPPFEGTLIS